jgi:alpha-ribazole phosphatase
MEIVMIRHFQTPGNLEKKYIGRTDEDLAVTSRLKELIEKRKKSCKNVEQVAASPLKRCIQTAGLLFPDQQPVLCNQLRECDFGIFEGKTYEQLKHLDVYRKWLDSEGAARIPEGESREIFQSRCFKGFLEIVEEWIKQGVNKAAMVVHGGTIMAVLSQLDQKERGFYTWQAENGGGYRIFLNEQEWKQGRNKCREILKL